MGVGGAPALALAVSSPDDVLGALERASALDLPVRVLGGGSNVVVHDDGVRACVLRFGGGEAVFEPEGDTTLARVDAGVAWDAFVAAAVERDLQGVECLSGIPGLVGATPIQNVGAYGQEVAQTINRVEVTEVATGRQRALTGDECQFRYRDSFFKSVAPGRFIVTRVEFRLHRAAPPSLKYAELKQAASALERPPTLRDVRALVLALRQSKSMLIAPGDENRRSCGSFFVNAQMRPADYERLASLSPEPPPTFPGPDGTVKVPSAWLIERAGLARGTRLGPVGLSTRHALCIVAHAGASAKDVVGFAWHVRNRVEAAFGVTLVPEPQFWGFEQLDQGLPTLPRQVASQTAGPSLEG